MKQSLIVNSLLPNLLIVLHGICLVGAFGHTILEVPLLLQVVGRAHPLMLHFPIVLLLLLSILLWNPKTLANINPGIAQLIFLVSLCLTGITVLAGLLLASEEGYVAEEYFAHQWFSMGLFWLATAWYIVWRKSWFLLARVASVGTVLIMLLAGHLGASMTHGEDFLWAPFQQKAIPNTVSLADASAFDHVVLPILEQKCIACHKASKQKGELRLDAAAYLLLGGKHGPVIDTLNLGLSPLLQRLLLPLEDEAHMPPKGKAQLTAEELAILRAWIEESAHFDKKVSTYPIESPFFQLASVRLTPQQDHSYNFPFAPSQAIAKVSTDYRVVQALHPASPALRISFFGKGHFQSAHLDELSVLKEQVVEINLSNMPLQEEDLKKLAQFSNLEKLNLNNTGIKGVHLDALLGLNSLRSLSLVGNPIALVNLETLGELTQVKSLFLWNSGLDAQAIRQLSAMLPQTSIEQGYQVDGLLYPLNPPLILAKSGIFQDRLEVRLKHPIGSVGIFYTLDNSHPDSSNYLLYEKPILLEKNTNLRVRAFAEGWLGSEESNAVFFKAGVRPSSYRLSHAPHQSYKGDGVETLFDLEKGDEDFTSGKWVGFQDDACELIMDFEPSKSLTSLSLSVLTAEASYIFPPALVEIWTKTSQGNWVLLHADKPAQPKQTHDRKLHLLEYPLPSDPISQLKAIIKPVNRLPHWHTGAGEKGWVFLDEVLVN